MSSGAEEQSVKVVLLGDSGVGKSSLALRFVTDEFRPYSEATIGASFMSKSITLPSIAPSHSNTQQSSSGLVPTSQRNIGFKIWDTAGQEKYRSLAPMYYRGSSAAILVYDITNPASFTALQDWAVELQQNGPPDLALVVCGNKLDLADFRKVERRVGEEYAIEIGAWYVETSAKDGEGVENMFFEVARRVPPLATMGEEEKDVLDVLDLGNKTATSRGYCC